MLGRFQQIVLVQCPCGEQHLCLKIFVRNCEARFIFSVLVCVANGMHVYICAFFHSVAIHASLPAAHLPDSCDMSFTFAAEVHCVFLPQFEGNTAAHVRCLTNESPWFWVVTIFLLPAGMHEKSASITVESLKTESHEKPERTRIQKSAAKLK